LADEKNNQGRCQIFIYCKDPKKELHYIAFVGLDLVQTQMEFLTTLAANDISDLHLTKPHDEPAILRKELINNKIALREEKGGFLVKQAEQLFRPIFQRHHPAFIQLLKAGEENKMEQVVTKKVQEELNSPGAELNFYFFWPTKEQQTAETSAQAPAEKNQQTIAKKPHGYGGKTIPVSPLVGVGDGLPAREARYGDEIMVKLAPEAIEALETKVKTEKQRQELTQPRPARIVEYNPLSEDSGRLKLELQEGLPCTCVITPDTLLKPAPAQRSGDPFEGNIQTIILLLVLIIVIFTLFVLTL